jgi:hypothetical protein
MAGQSQSPTSIFATTSTLPYLSVFLPLVVNRAERTGLMISPVVLLLLMEQEVYGSVDVHSPVVVRFKT